MGKEEWQEPEFLARKNSKAHGVGMGDVQLGRRGGSAEQPPHSDSHLASVSQSKKPQLRRPQSLKGLKLYMLVLVCIIVITGTG